MFIKKARLILLSLLLLGVNSYALDEFVPAKLSGDKHSLQNRIKFPDIEGDISVIVICDASVNRWGKFKFNVCFSEKDDKQIELFEKAVHKAARKAQIEPARINGRNKTVWFQYSVEFTKKDGSQTIEVRGNHGHDSHRYGKGYTSAQRYKKGVGSYFYRCNNWLTNVWIKAIIDENGTPIKSESIGGYGNEYCKRSIEAAVMKGKYIPAMHNGQPVSSIYIESFFNTSVAERR